MKLQPKQSISVLLTAMVVVNILAPSAALALTEETSSVQSSKIGSTLNSSQIPAQSTTTMQQDSEETEESSATEEAKKEPIEVEKIEQEKKYEDRTIDDQEAQHSPQPIITLSEKKESNNVSIKGKINAGEEIGEKTRTETKLLGLFLQRKQANGEWKTVSEHSLDKKTDYLLNQEEVQFNFDTENDPLKEYRIAVDYEVKTYEENELAKLVTHKGQYLVGELDVVRTESESIEQQESSEMTEPSSSTVDSSEGEKSFEEPKSTEENSTTESTTKESEEQVESNAISEKSEKKKIPTARSTSQIPKLNKRLNSLEKRTLIPMASTTTDVNYVGDDGNYVNIRNITKNSASVGFSSYSPEYPTTLPGKIVGVVSKNKNFINDTDTTSGSQSFISSSTLNTIRNSEQAQICEFSTTSHSKLITTDSDGIFSNLDTNETYYLWLIRIYVDPLPFPGTSAQEIGRYLGFNGLKVGSALRNDPFSFTTAQPTALQINAPKFTQASATTATIPMVGQNYTGDISQTGNSGIVQVTSNNGVSYETKKSGLTHTRTTNGTYNGASITGLTPGTQYRGRVGLKDYGGTLKYSGLSSYFYTPNTVNQPAVPTLNVPTASNNATAQVSAIYNVGNVAAHPNKAEVQISTDGSNWYTASSSSAITTTTPVIDTTNKKVSFTLSKLTSNKTYYVKYRVQNASGIWSSYSAPRVFTTNGVDVSNISFPSINPEDGVTDRVKINPGTYLGEANETSGTLRVDKTNSLGWVSVYDPELPLTLSNSTGKYSLQGGNYLTGLEAGTKYATRVVMKNTAGQWRSSLKNNPQNSANEIWTYFYTPNKVSQPDTVSTGNLGTPTGSDNATATITASYEANTDSGSRADPTGDWSKVKAYLSTTSGTANDFQEVTNSNTTTSGYGRPTGTPTVNTSNKKVTFSISNLKSNKKYWVKFKVMNASGKWSNLSSARDFTTKGVDVSNISFPSINPEDGVTDRVKINPGTYLGDADETSGTLRVDKTNSSGWESVYDPELPLTLSNSTGKYSLQGGNYLTGLEAGTKYVTRVVMKNSAGQWRNSLLNNPQNSTDPIWTYFYTPNEVSQPDTVSTENLGTPTGSDNATATITASYEANTDSGSRADPTGDWSKVKAYLSTTSGTANDFQEVTSSNAVTSGKGRPADTPSVNTSNRKVTFSISNLKSSKKYWVKFKVMNASGKWSNLSSAREFTTKGVPITYDPTGPVMEVTSSTSAKLKTGQVSGDVDQNNMHFYLNEYLGSNNYAGQVFQGEVPVTLNTNNNAGTHKYALGDLNVDNNVYQLKAGTHYTARLTTRYSTGSNWQSSAITNWFTPNTVNTPSSTTYNNPSSMYGASALVHGSYNVSHPYETNDGAHPKTSGVTEGISGKGIQVQLKAKNANEDSQYSSWVNLTEQTSSSSRAYISSVTINQIADAASTEKDIDFAIQRLRENTEYYVRYRVMNDSNIWSDNWSTSDYCIHTTSRAAGFYINSVPNMLNFNNVEFSNTNSLNTLQSSVGTNPLTVDFESVNMTSNWKLMAKLSPLTKWGGTPSDQLNGAKINLGKRLKKMNNDGSTWSTITDTNLFDGVDLNSMTLNADNTSNQLWKSKVLSDSHGHFRNEIDISSVNLELLGGTGAPGTMYNGNVTWTMDITP